MRFLPIVPALLRHAATATWRLPCLLTMSLALHSAGGAGRADASASEWMDVCDQHGACHARVVDTVPDIGAHEVAPMTATASAACRWMRCWPEQQQPS
jgi:hypothetical protein